MAAHHGRDTGAPRAAVAVRVVLAEIDGRRMQALVLDIVARRLDALLFSRSDEARRLLRAARQMELLPALVDALRADVVVGAVDLRCASALRRRGLVADVIPGVPTVAGLVAAVDEYFELTAPSLE